MDEFRKTRISVCTDKIKINDIGDECLLLDIDESIKYLKFSNVLLENKYIVTLFNRVITIVEDRNYKPFKVLEVHIPDDEYICAYDEHNHMEFEFIQFDNDILIGKGDIDYPKVKAELITSDNNIDVIFSIKFFPKDLYWVQLDKGFFYENNVSTISNIIKRYKEASDNLLKLVESPYSIIEYEDGRNIQVKYEDGVLKDMKDDVVYAFRYITKSCKIKEIEP